VVDLETIFLKKTKWRKNKKEKKKRIWRETKKATKTAAGIPTKPRS
jgi:hypothetical protein